MWKSEGTLPPCWEVACSKARSPAGYAKEVLKLRRSRFAGGLRGLRCITHQKTISHDNLSVVQELYDSADLFRTGPKSGDLDRPRPSASSLPGWLPLVLAQAVGKRRGHQPYALTTTMRRTRRLSYLYSSSKICSSWTFTNRPLSCMSAARTSSAARRSMMAPSSTKISTIRSLTSVGRSSRGDLVDEIPCRRCCSQPICCRGTILVDGTV